MTKKQISEDKTVWNMLKVFPTEDKSSKTIVHTVDREAGTWQYNEDHNSEPLKSFNTIML